MCCSPRTSCWRRTPQIDWLVQWMTWTWSSWGLHREFQSSNSNNTHCPVHRDGWISGMDVHKSCPIWNSDEKKDSSTPTTPHAVTDGVQLQVDAAICNFLQVAETHSIPLRPTAQNRHDTQHKKNTHSSVHSDWCLCTSHDRFKFLIENTNQMLG